MAFFFDLNLLDFINTFDIILIGYEGVSILRNKTAEIILNFLSQFFDNNLF